MSQEFDFSHVLMTRFNLPTGGKESQIRQKSDWLEERFDLFERYCLPTIAAQSSKNFNWIIYFDDQTPDLFKRRIERNQEIFPFHAYYTDLFDSDGWPRSVHDTLTEKKQWLLTTRLDNDDGLAIDFVARLHDKVSSTLPLSTCAFNFDHGLVLQGQKIYDHHHPCNAFFSWLEPFDKSAVTACAIQHMSLANHGEIHHIDAPASWLQVVHGDNVSNKIRGCLTSPSSVAQEFPQQVLANLVEPSHSELLYDSLFMAPIRTVRDQIISAVNKFRGQN